MKQSRYWVVAIVSVCLGFQTGGVFADTKSAALKQYLPQVDLRLGGIYGPTDSEDTVAEIAKSILPPGNVVSIEKVIKAIVIKNPDAFSAGNSKTLKVGVLLKLPTVEEIQDPHGQKKAELHKLQILQSDNDALKKENAALLLKLQEQSNVATTSSATMADSQPAVTTADSDPATVILGSIFVPVAEHPAEPASTTVTGTPAPELVDSKSVTPKPAPVSTPTAAGSKNISPVSSLLTEEGN